MSAPSGTDAIELSVNGEPQRVPAGTTIAALLATLDVPPRGTAVELNLELVPRARHAETLLASGDRLEIVTLVGGG
ncbi:MAG TPA: sulfur carrier protein ThiS [Pirellulales bacterium]